MTNAKNIAIETESAITLAQLEAKSVFFSESKMPTLKKVSALLNYLNIEHTFIHGNTIRISGVFADGSKGYTTHIDSSKTYYSRNASQIAREILALIKKA